MHSKFQCQTYMILTAPGFTRPIDVHKSSFYNLISSWKNYQHLQYQTNITIMKHIVIVDIFSCKLSQTYKEINRPCKPGWGVYYSAENETVPHHDFFFFNKT